MADPDLDWLGDMRWHGYPRLESLRDLGPDAGAGDAPAVRGPVAAAAADPRAAELAKDNESLRARLEALTRLAAEFDRRLSETATAYEAAVLEAESRLRDAVAERQHLSGGLSAAKDECARLAARDAAREADLRLERERRSDAEKALAEMRRRLEAHTDQDVGLLRQEMRDFIAKFHRIKESFGEKE